jgi:hypothetical protein
VIAGDPTATVSIRVSDAARATFPGCTGTPACIGTVTVAPGASSASVTLSTTAGSADEMTIAADATWSHTTASSQLILDASAGSTPPPPPANDTLTVMASGRSGLTIVSSPAGISVATGSSQSAEFAPGTSITLSDARGRSVIWSGACTSNGRATRSCTFAIESDASVAAAVQ